MLNEYAEQREVMKVLSWGEFLRVQTIWRRVYRKQIEKGKMPEKAPARFYELLETLARSDGVFSYTNQLGVTVYKRY